MDKSMRQTQSDTAIVLKGHTDAVRAVAVTPDGKRAVSASADNTLRIWDLASGELVATLQGHKHLVAGVAVTPDGTRAVSAAYDNTLLIWDLASGKSLATLEGHTDMVLGVAVAPGGTQAVSTSLDHTLRIWDLASAKSVTTLDGPEGAVYSVAVTPDGRQAVSAHAAGLLLIWDLASGKAVASLKGHTSPIFGVAVTPDGRRAVSASADKTLRIWDLISRTSVATLEGHTGSVYGVAITPDGSRAVSGSADNTLRIWDLISWSSVGTLEGHTNEVMAVAVTQDGSRAVSASQDKTLLIWDLRSIRKASYTNAKVLLVGDTGVGKTGLAHRLTTGMPPGQLLSSDAAWATQWPLPHEPKAEQGEREIWLWDFAGQPDYRLAHSLYMDDTALTVFVFDPQDRNPIAGLAEWDRMMTRASKRPFAKLLVAGRCDRGGLMISRDLIEQFRRDHQFGAYLETSAHTGTGCEELGQAIASQIDWDAIPYTVSPVTFRKLKQIIVKIKDRATAKRAKKKKALPLPVIMSSDALSKIVAEEWDGEPGFTDNEFRAAVSLLHGPGVVWKLEFGDLVLLQPERINAYAAALVRKVRKHINEIGLIPEAEVLAGDLEYADMDRLRKEEEQIVLRAMHLMVVDRGLCIRQHGPNAGALLIFPSLYKRERPERPYHPHILMTFRFEGHLDEIYATLVVRLHYTDGFDVKQLWLDAADFVSLTDEKLGMKMTRHEGQGEITVFADENVSENTRLMFVKYVHEHLNAKDPNCLRVRHYVCGSTRCKEPFRDQTAIDRARSKKQKHVFCAECGKKIILDDIIEQKFTSAQTAEQARTMQEQAQAVLDNESKELILVGHTYVIAGEAGQIYRQYTNSDHGIDGEIQFKKDSGEAASALMYIQLKSGDSYLSSRRDGTEIFVIKSPHHVEYWRSRQYPVMLVVRASDGRIRWMDVRAYLQREHAASRQVKQIVFDGEPFTAAGILAMRDRVLWKELRASSEKDESLLDIIQEEQHPVSDRPGDIRAFAISLSKIADDLQTGGKAEESLKILREKVLPIFEQLGDVHSGAVTQAKIAEILRSRAELDEALHLLREKVLPVFDQLDDVPSKADALGKIADILQARGEIDEALRLLREDVLPVFDLLEDVHSQAVTLTRLAHLLAARGDFAKPEDLPLLERIERDKALSQAVREKASSLRYRTRTDQVTQWRNWLYGLLPEADFRSLPSGDLGFPSVEVGAIRLRQIRAFADTKWLSIVESSTQKPLTCVLVLGDNAAGKSTLLRCIALAALGPDAATQVAGRPDSYLRRGGDVGYLEVEFHLRIDDADPPIGTTFCVGLKIVSGENSFRSMDNGEMSLPGELNAAERVSWIRRLSGQRFGFLCGYGALRSIFDLPSGLTPEETKETLTPVISLFRPGVPLLDPDVLGRVLAGDMSSIRSAPLRKLDAGVQQALGHHLKTLLPGSGGIEEQQPSLFHLHGQVIPLRDLSDGYSSLLALAGHLFIQALPALNWQCDPASLPGVVLIDEIDLHLHPAWQRHILSDLQQVFPKLQIIASSHSPMVAGSVRTENIIVTRQQANEVEILTDLPSVKGWRCDQILTSVLFDLESTRDLMTANLLDRYEELAVRDHLSPQDQEEFLDVSRSLDVRVPTSHERKEARAAFAMIQDANRKRIEALPLEIRQRVITELKVQLQEILTNSRRPT